MRRTTRWAGLAGVIACSIGLAGCITSNSSKYQHRLTAVMQGDSSYDRHVAAASRIEGDRSAPPKMIANAPDQ